MMVDDVALRAAFRDFARAVVGYYDADQMLHLLTDQSWGSWEWTVPGCR